MFYSSLPKLPRAKIKYRSIVGNAWGWNRVLNGRGNVGSVIVCKNVV